MATSYDEERRQQSRRRELQCCPLFVPCSAFLLLKLKKSCFPDFLPALISVSPLHPFTTVFFHLTFKSYISITLLAIFTFVFPPFLLSYMFHPPSFTFPLMSISIFLLFLFYLISHSLNLFSNSVSLPAPPILVFTFLLCQYFSITFLIAVLCPLPLACCIIQMCICYAFSSLHLREIFIGCHRKVSRQAKSAIYPHLLSRIWVMHMQDDGVWLTGLERAHERQNMCGIMRPESIWSLSLCTRYLSLACMFLNR